ncbi:MAG: EamA family transporter, partial [Rubrivivax sp.]
MPEHPRSLGILALLVATSAWGGMFLVSKGVLDHIGPVWLTFLRYTIAALIFVPLLIPRGAAPWRKLRTAVVPLSVR